MRLNRVVSIYEIFAGACGLMVLIAPIRQPYSHFLLLFAVTLLVYSILALVAGILIWKDSYLGYRLGQIGEWLRLLRFATPWASYYAFLGLDLNVGLQLFTHGIPEVGDRARNGLVSGSPGTP